MVSYCLAPRPKAVVRKRCRSRAWLVFKLCALTKGPCQTRPLLLQYALYCIPETCDCHTDNCNTTLGRYDFAKDGAKVNVVWRVVLVFV